MEATAQDCRSGRSVYVAMKIVYAGGGVEYYNAYSGAYTGIAADSTHRYANTANGATRFNGLDYQGRFSLPTPWELHATNRVDGKTNKFWARLEAVRNGYVLVLTDSDYEPLPYQSNLTPSRPVRAPALSREPVL